MVLREVTYFYGANTSWEHPRDMQLGKTLCTKELLYAIIELVVNYHAQSGDEGSVSDKPAGQVERGAAGATGRAVWGFPLHICGPRK